MKELIKKNNINLFLEPRIKELIDQVQHIIDDDLEPEGEYKLYIFGSRAKNLNNSASDIDLAVQSEFLTEEKFNRVKHKIREIRTLYSIDLVNLDSVDEDFRKIILKDAKKIYG